MQITKATENDFFTKSNKSFAIWIIVSKAYLANFSQCDAILVYC